MMRAREHAELLGDEADYQLHIIYLWYEKDPQRALALLTGLRDRHPRNPLFPQLIAQVQDVYFHDLQASLRTWRSMLDAARGHRIAYSELAEMRSRLGIRFSARASQRQQRRDRATASGDRGQTGCAVRRVRRGAARVDAL
jgi:hypothetical protein